MVCAKPDLSGSNGYHLKCLTNEFITHKKRIFAFVLNSQLLLRQMQNIHFTENIAHTFVDWLTAQSYSRVIILCDQNTVRDCLPILADSRAVFPSIITVPFGESHKNIDTVQLIWQKLLAINADRHTLLVNLGGGVIGDMGGFAAATYKRGIDFVQIPTTLLAMIDASVGGKLGIDFGNIKNSIGVFQLPKAVFYLSFIFKNIICPRTK